MKKKNNGIFKLLILIFLTCFTLSLAVLLFWGLFAALKPVSEFRLNKLWLPKGYIWNWAWSNFAYVYDNFYMTVLNKQGFMTDINVYTMLFNSVVYCLGCSFAGTVVPCVCAYVSEKFPFKFGKVMYLTVLVAMMLPIVGAYPSEIYLLKKLNLYDSFGGMMILKANFLGLYFLIFAATMRSIPNAFAEAAYIDGAGEWRVMLSILFPLVKNTFFTVFLLQTISYWNDYQTVLLYLPTHPTISFGLYDLSNSLSQGLNNVPMRMAGVYIVMIPMLILFIVFSDKLMGNLSMGGLKE